MIIDWLSWTKNVQPTSNEQIARDRLLDAIHEDEEFAFWLWQLDKRTAAPRRPYCIARQWGHIRAFAGVNINHVLFEVSGQGCDQLREAGMLDRVLDLQNTRFTRIDVAFDILGVSPDEIIETGYSGAFKAHSRMQSQTGITHYVGSPKSERYARVYRYNDPHPRANLCRIEIVHRKRYARILARAIKEEGLTSAGLSALASYKFKHDKVPVGANDVLATVAIIKGDQKTVHWMIAQVAPAFRRLVLDGTITDPMAFFNEHFVPTRH